MNRALLTLLLPVTALLFACDPPGGNPDPGDPPGDAIADAQGELAECVDQRDDADTIEGLRIVRALIDQPLDPGGEPTTLTVGLAEVDGYNYMNYPLAIVTSLDNRLAVQDEVPPELTLFGIFACTESQGSTTLRVVGNVDPGETLPIQIEASALNCDDCGGHTVMLQVPVE